MEYKELHNQLHFLSKQTQKTNAHIFQYILIKAIFQSQTLNGNENLIKMEEYGLLTQNKILFGD